MKNPLISICIPTYNGQSFLDACLDSAIGQTYTNIEIIIVDDCSTDDTWSVITSYADKDRRIKVFKNEKNLGLVSNWNRCVELSSGEWIKFLFQDDYLAIDCVQEMMNTVSGEDKIITSARRLVLPDNEIIKGYYSNEILTFEKLGITPYAPVFISPKRISSWAVQHICINFIGEPTVVMFKKDVINEMGIFNPDLIQICDLEYFLRIASNYGIRYCPKALSYFRIHKDSTSVLNITKKTYSINNIDPVIMSYEMLYASFYARFRAVLSVFQKMKLKMFFMIRVRESYVYATKNSTDFKTFEDMQKAYPKITTYSKGNILTRFFLPIIKLRRVFIKGH